MYPRLNFLLTHPIYIELQCQQMHRMHYIYKYIYPTNRFSKNKCQNLLGGMIDGDNSEEAGKIILIPQCRNGHRLWQPTQIMSMQGTLLLSHVGNYWQVSFLCLLQCVSLPPSKPCIWRIQLQQSGNKTLASQHDCQDPFVRESPSSHFLPGFSIYLLVQTINSLLDSEYLM